MRLVHWALVIETSLLSWNPANFAPGIAKTFAALLLPAGWPMMEADDAPPVSPYMPPLGAPCFLVARGPHIIPSSPHPLRYPATMCLFETFNSASSLVCLNQKALSSLVIRRSAGKIMQRDTIMTQKQAHP